MSRKNRVTLITGGARSGKSRHALELAGRCDSAAFIATSIPSDDEMKQRIKNHRKDRGKSFTTIEEPANLANAVSALPAGTEVAVIDCLTTWLGNLMHGRPGRKDFDEIEAFLKTLETPPCDLIIVTNEVGMGIVPDNAMARRFRDTAGHVNQRTARLADEMILMVSGIATTIKEASNT